ncbi:hypothetical protein [Methylomonas sp. UP202]|uniref:hypothetical protein n=1 Tax=Methylomonas sp. UP202 TaxID=3040943 RepID=UPI00247886A1|nr:hypothetical protein [Methylomonas sp. UP202]WGS84977.1 hypothetical protein QC632_18260 [Methylomonas sp. UP202]
MSYEVETSLDTLPPIKPGATVKTQARQFQLRLPTETYLRLEMEAARRATTSYKLAATILAMFLNGKFLIKQDQPSPVEGDPDGVNHED